MFLKDTISSMYKVKGSTSSKYLLAVPNGIQPTLTATGNKYIHINVWVCVSDPHKRLQVHIFLHNVWRFQILLLQYGIILKGICSSYHTEI